MSNKTKVRLFLLQFNTLIAMKKIPVCILLLLFVIAVAGPGCKNPLKEEKKKELVIILLHEYLAETGRYIVYWDGKDKNGKYVQPGKYYYVMEVKSFQDQDVMVAEAGGKLGKNNEQHFEPGFWNDFELGQAYPNPFRILEGVNIPIIVSEPATVKLTIFKD